MTTAPSTRPGRKAKTNVRERGVSPRRTPHTRLSCHDLKASVCSCAARTAVRVAQAGSAKLNPRLVSRRPGSVATMMAATRLQFWFIIHRAAQ